MNAPVLSAIVMTPDTWHTMRRTLAALRGQTLRHSIELVLVGPSLEALDVPEAEIAGFAQVRKTAAPPNSRILGESSAAGVRSASAALVVFTEDHCFPEPGWAEALVKFHADGNWAGVEPTFINGNPDSVASKVQFLVEYAHSAPGEAKGEAPFIAGHNSCYRRDALLHYDRDGGLADWLEVEFLMHQDMGRRGLRLGRSAEARTHHYNCSRVGATLSFSWVFPRVFAAHRARRLGPVQRLKLALTWPLIAPLRFQRIWPLAWRLYGTAAALRLSPLLLANLMVSAASEGAGYVLGAGRHPELAFGLEFHRDRFFRSGDRFPDVEA